MDRTPDMDLQKRVEHLERTVAELQKTVSELNRPTTPPAPSTRTGESPPPTAPPSSTVPLWRRQPRTTLQDRFPASLQQGETWLKLFGIGLFLFGIAFLFKYSIDQGWITETVRLGIGFALATILLATGFALHGRRRSFSLVLLGGGIAAYYITGFAAFQLYALVSHPVAFAFMVCVTLLALFLSLRQQEATLSIIGALGGLGTPFLLYTGSGDIPSLVAYTCLLLSGTSAIYLARGWRSLLWASAVGGLLVLATALDALPWQPPSSDRWAVQSGLFFALLAFWAVPLLRELLFARAPNRWPRPDLARIAGWSPSAGNLADRHVHLLSISVPIFTLVASTELWDFWRFGEKTLGWITLSGAAVLAVVAYSLKRFTPLASHARTHALVSLLLATVALCILLEGDFLFFTMAAEAAILHFLSHRLDDRTIARSGHLLFLGVAVALAIRLFSLGAEGSTIFNPRAATDLAIVAVALLASFRLRTPVERQIYRLLLHLALLGWFLRELSPLSDGEGYVTLAWGIYAILLLLIGLRLDYARLSQLALATLLLVVGKLFLFDLARLEAIWRILLFMGFGAIFLILSYFYRALWKNRIEVGTETRGDDGMPPR